MKKQLGFTVLEIVLVITLLGVLVGIGAFAFSRISDNNNAKSTDSISDAKNFDKITDKAKAAYTFTAEDNAFSVDIPDGWKFTYSKPSQDTNFTHYLETSTNRMIDTPGIAGEVGVPSATGGAVTGVQFKAYKNNGPTGFGYEMKSLGSLRTAQGKEVSIFQDESATEPFSDDESNASGYTEYNYYIHTDSYYYEIRYSKTNSDPDQRKDVENMIKTLRVS